MKKNVNIPKTFFGFLTVSIFFWLLINLSKEYNTTVKYDIEYTQLPQQKTLISTPLKELSVTLKSTGYNLLLAGFSHKKIKLPLTKVVKKKDKNYYFLSKTLLPEVQKQLKSGLDLVSIHKDTIPLVIGTLGSKKVALKHNTNITFQLGYDLSQPIQVTPDSIVVSGDKNSLQNIDFLNLKNTNLEHISKNTSITSPIVFPKDVMIKTSISSAKINITVDKFTEGEIEVPVFVKNAPDGINIYPKKVKIIFKSGLKNFNEVTPDVFKVECDYLEAKNKEINYLTPKLKSNTTLAKVVRMTPDKIDFLIYE